MCLFSCLPVYYRCKNFLEGRVNYCFPPQSLCKFIVIKTSQMTGIAAIGYVALRYIAAPIAHQILERSENIHKHSLIVESLIGFSIVVVGGVLPMTIIYMRAQDGCNEWKKKHPLLGLEEPKDGLSFLSPRDSFAKHLLLESIKVTSCILSTLAIFSLIAHFSVLNNNPHQEMHKTLAHKAIIHDVIGGSVCMLLVMGLIGGCYQPYKDLTAEYERWKASEVRVLAQRECIARRKE